MSNFYFKTRKRMIAWICAITMVVAGLTVVPKKVVAGDAETDYSTLTWKDIGFFNQTDSSVHVSDGSGKKYNVQIAKLDAESKGNIGNDIENNIKVYNENYMQIVWGAGSYNKSYVILNGEKLESGKTGIAVANNEMVQLQTNVFLKADSYNKIKVICNDTEYATFAIKVGNPGGSGTETPTPEGTKPIMGTGVVVQNLGNKTLYIAGLKTITNATKYELYQDGKLLREVNDGDNIPLSELTPGKHEYYVIGVNDYGKSEPSKTFEIVIPEVKASKNIIVDNGAPETVEEDSEYKFGDAKYGYYDINKNVIYKAGSTIKVKDNMHLVSINDIRLSFTNGAAIRIEAGVPTPGGIRFQAKLDVTCGVAEYKNAIINALQAGTMITTKDILEKSGKDYTVENIKEIGTVLNVENKNGWKDADTHTFNASLINIVEANYTRYFVAKAYVKVPYANDVPAEYVYSENDANSAVQVERSISDIAKTIQSNNYDGETNEDIKSLINSFIKK